MISQAYGKTMASVLDLVRDVRERELYPFEPAFAAGQDVRTRLHERDVLVMSTSNYLGLAGHPEITEAMKSALDRFGSGNCGARLVNGTTTLHLELETRLAEWLGTEAALTFSSGYMANLGAISAMCDSETVIVTDQFNHMSIMDGCRLAESRIKIFSHNSMAKLAYILERNADASKRFIVVDGVYSMDGDLAPLAEIAELARRHDAMTMVDEAHGLGVMGPGGRGACEHFGVSADLLMGTFSKSLAGVGGFVAGRRDVIEYLRHTSHTYAFNASLPAVTVAGVLTALDLLQREPWRMRRLWENTERFRRGLLALGFDVAGTRTPIVPVHIGDEMTALRMAKDLLDRGVYVFTAMYPAVPVRSARFRLTVTATMRPEDIDHALDALGEVGQAHGLLD
ncbi:aminotransferase class I/II-fold pyridoxal phosphate-dependent enzyme [Streptomyces sp. NPDC053079]|uniref:aminotransferase class I/II-fold pyridoxal phosphate-dependent enzyme n=1 Tax=Streptomyces sp. NPDC053079 TaxID=3365697 RepID=UPI0037D6A3D0